MKQAVDQADNATILEFLSSFQHLHPRVSVADALNEAVAALDCCPQAAEQAVRWLQIDPQASIGRLRRSQLVQLAQSMYRFWQRNLARQHQQAKPASAS